MKCLFAAFLLTFSLIGGVQAQSTVPQAGFADLVEKLSPAVVNISTTQKVKNPPMMFGMPFEGLPNSPEMEPFREFFDRFGQGMKQAPEREATSLGSGFVIDPKGYVITNNHVVEQAEEITVIFSDNTKYKAAIVGRDKKTDLALLKIDVKKDLPFAVMGDSDAMRVGDWVIAIGNPFGLGGSVTQGIISARQRSINAGPFDDFLQTDAPINRGNSGGPLFNTKGEVIGINTAIFSPSGGSVGIGFAIPTALAKPVVEQLKASGKVTRGWLGVKIQEVSEEIANSVGLEKQMGALVLDVSKASPADKVGIQAGDVITHFGGKEIKEMKNLPRLVAEAPIGKPAEIRFWRSGKAMSGMITVGELKDEAEKAGAGSKGSPAVPAAGEVVLGMRLVQGEGELQVAEVEAGSEAAKRGVREGDVIREVGGEKVTSASGLKQAMQAAKKAGRKFALVRISRGSEEAFIPLPVE
ncbi:MAG: DegQ family serine endoprotease [Alphaproteobacteria bacterium]|nr:DegQ family serine endoprotease [Alphaproteobacteria bacterium]